MKLRLWFLPMILASLFLISATSSISKPAAEKRVEQSELPAVATTVKKQKLNFVERLLLKYAIKRIAREGEDTTKADKQARTSLSFGIAAVGLILLGLFIPYVLLASIPAGIVAMATGGTALKEGTKETSKARTGKALGLASLITVGALFVLALLVVAAWAGWGG